MLSGQSCGWQVVLPAGPEGTEQVQDWVFKRTPAELKAAMQEAKRKREQSEVSSSHSAAPCLEFLPPQYFQSLLDSNASSSAGI